MGRRPLGLGFGSPQPLRLRIQQAEGTSNLPNENFPGRHLKQGNHMPCRLAAQTATDGHFGKNGLYLGL
jgi:hypothetical protein